MRKFTLFLAMLVAMVTTSMAQTLDFTFTKVSESEATVTVTGNEVEAGGITATIASNQLWKSLSADSEAFPNASIVCPDKNTNSMTAGNEGTITLTLNNVPEDYSFKNVTFTSVALNGGGAFQGDDENAQHVNFTLYKGETTLGVAENVKIKVNSSSKDYEGTKNQSVTVPFEVAEAYTAENGTLELKLTMSVTESKGCFYGLIKVSIETEVATVEPEPELAALEVVSADRNPLETAWEGKYKLQGVKLNFNEVVKRYNTASYDGDYGYILDADGNEVAKLDKCMGGNGTMNNFATPYSSTGVAVAGTYKVVVKPGVIFSADGTKEYKGGEFEFTVAQHDPVVTPSAEDGLCYNESFTKVDDFREFTITVQYATEVVIDAEKKVELKYIKKQGYQTVGEEIVAEATVTLADVDATTKEIKITFPEQEYAEGSYSFDIPAALFTVNGVANEVYASNTFTYKKPQLKITRDFDSWESYLDSKWYMPTAAMITIANAETVEVDETKVATIAVGESVYKSTLSYYYDDWSNAYYIELIFEDFLAEGFEFVKGDYTFTLPAGLYTVNGIANEEAVKTYTYGDPIVEEFSVTEILPAPGSVLESLDAISITFSNGAQPEILPITCGEKTYYFIYQNGLYVAVDLMSYEPIVITEPGTYTLDLSELEGLTGDKVFSWTIAEAVEPEPTPGEVDYTPDFTGTKTRTGRNITSVSLGENTYSLLTPEQSSCYVDATETVTFTVEAGATVKATVAYQGEWMHHAVYIDFDGDGFTSGIEEGSEWKPAGDLVAYSFYNNNGSSDEYGYNSVGTYMSGMDRHVPEIPEFAVPTTPGTYRIRFVQDWCSINPSGDSDGKFGDFMANGGQIVDVMLEVTEPTGIDEVKGESGEVKAIYDLTGRKIETITKAGIYIVNGKKVLVK